MIKGLIKGFFISIGIMILIGIAIILLIAFAIASNDVFGMEPAKPNIKHIGIEFSESCLMLISLNDLDTCSTPEFLKILYPETPLKEKYQTLFDNAQTQNKENSFQNKSVQNFELACIKFNQCDIYQLKPNQDVIFWYLYDDKERDYLDHIIVITPNILHLSYEYDGLIIENQTGRHLQTDINQVILTTCHFITYNPVVIWKELGFIINYIKNNCQDLNDLGALNEPYTIPLNKTEFNPLDSPSYIYREYLESLKSKYKNNMLGKD